jgi:peroxin-1
MASASSLAHFNTAASSELGDVGFETVEIDPQYAQGLGFSQGDIVRISSIPPSNSLLTSFKVEIGLLHDLPFAKSVSSEPLTADDWEIIVCFFNASGNINNIDSRAPRKSTRHTSNPISSHKFV